MFFETMIVALAAGLLAGGRLTNLGRVHIRHVYIIIAAYLIQAGIDFWAPKQVLWVYPYLHIISYLLLFFAIWRNRMLPGFKLLLAGTFLNFVVIALNGGQMPVRADVIPAHLRELLAAGQGGTHGLLSGETLFSFLGDVLYVPLPYQKQLISLGDIVINLGAFWLIVSSLKGRGYTQS